MSQEEEEGGVAPGSSGRRPGPGVVALRERVEALAPLALEVWEQTMRSAEKDADRLRAADAVMARVMPILQVHQQGLTVHVHLSREERRAIEVVAREIGRELPALPAPDDAERA